MLPSKRIQEIISFWGGVAGGAITCIGILWGVFSYLKDAKETKQRTIILTEKVTKIEKQNTTLISEMKYLKKNVEGVKTVLELHVKDTKDELNYWKYIPNNINFIDYKNNGKQQPQQNEVKKKIPLIMDLNLSCQNK